MTSRLTLVATVALLSAGLPEVAFSQRVSELQDGARVRIIPANGKALIGTAANVTSDSMTILFPGSEESLRVELRNATRVEVSTGVSYARAAGIYALAGLGIGAVAGAVVGAVIPDNSSSCSRLCGRDAGAALVGFFGGIIGGIAGFTTGIIHGRESWKPLSP